VFLFCEEKCMEKLKILLADDENDIVELARESLQREGYDVITAEDGQEAIDKIKGENPDVILLDLIMPKKSGFEVLSELRANPVSAKWQPVIIVSASGELEDIQKGYSLGADHYMTKPCTAQDIMKSVNLMINLIPKRKTAEQLKKESE